MANPEQNNQPIEITKDLVVKIINEHSGNSVDVYTDKCIHKADWTGPDEYDSFEAYVSFEADSQQDGSYEVIYVIDTSCASLSEDHTAYYFTPIESVYFNDVIKIIDEIEESPVDRTDLIGILANEDADHYLLIYKNTDKKAIDDMLEEIWNKTNDDLEISYEPPEPPEPDPDEYHYRYDGRWD